MEQIGEGMLVSSVMVVIILLYIISVPSIYLTMRASSKQLRKYKVLRSIDDISEHKDVPPELVNEWNVVKSQMAYTTIITEEIERLGALRPAFSQAELAIILSIVLAFWPGYATSVMILMIVIIVLSVIVLIYARMNTKMYAQEYLALLSEVNTKAESGDNGAADGMYG